jgi:hypothetical protein
MIFVQLQRLAPRGRVTPSDEVKERLQLQARKQLSGLTKALALLFLSNKKQRNTFQNIIGI